MRVCQECGKKCRKKFRMKKGYMGKDRYHKLLVINQEHIVVRFVIICQECMGWNGEKIFCGICLDINPLCGFCKTDSNYVGVCNECARNSKDEYNDEFLLNILVVVVVLIINL